MSQLPDSLTVDDTVYDTVPDEARIAVTYLLSVKNTFGIHDDSQLTGTLKDAKTGNQVVIKFAKEIFKVWAALYPEEHREFIKSTEFELKYERPVEDAVKAGGYSPISYPVRLDQLFHILIPSIKTQDKRFWIPLLKDIPEIKRSNYIK